MHIMLCDSNLFLFNNTGVSGQNRMCHVVRFNLIYPFLGNVVGVFCCCCASVHSKNGYIIT